RPAEHEVHAGVPQLRVLPRHRGSARGEGEVVCAIGDIDAPSVSRSFVSRDAARRPLRLLPGAPVLGRPRLGGRGRSRLGRVCVRRGDQSGAGARCVRRSEVPLRRIELAVVLIVACMFTPGGEAEPAGKVYRLGILMTTRVSAFEEELKKFGYIEGQNL